MNRSTQAAVAVLVLLALTGGGLLVVTASRYFSAAYHAGRAPALARSGHLDQAVAESRLATTLAPSLPMAHNNLGFYLFKQGKFTEAEVECRKAVSLDPSDSHAHDSLGELLSHTGRADEAVQQCREAVRLRSSAVHLNSLAMGLCRSSRAANVYPACYPRVSTTEGFVPSLTLA